MKANQHLVTATTLMAGFCFALVLLFSGCSKDEKDEGQDVVNIFSVMDAQLRPGSFPSGSASGPAIEHFSGNQYVLPGGSNAIVIESDDQFNAILVGAKGVSGYFELPYNSTHQENSTAVVYLFINPELIVNDFTILIALRNGNNTGNARELFVNLVEAGTGVLQVNLSWDKEVDLDLYLVEPNGETIFFANPYSENGGMLDVDSNAGCTIDGINNENITYGEGSVVQAGEYVVRVNLWAVCDVSEQINYISTVRVNGQIITPAWGSNPKQGFYPEGSESQYGGVDAGIEIIKFAINESALENAETYAHFSFPSILTKDSSNAKLDYLKNND